MNLRLITVLALVLVFSMAATAQEKVKAKTAEKKRPKLPMLRSPRA